MNLRIVYSDNFIAVAEKPAGMLSVPGRGEDGHECAANEIRRIFPGGINQPSVHRLDMDTSGLIVFALTKESHRSLSIQFQKSLVAKKYVALLDGKIAPELGDGGRIELRFRLNPDDRPKQVFDPVHGKVGITQWKKIEEDGNLTRVEFIPLTGRTHQLRLHASHPVSIIGGKNKGGLGCPIAGDRLYGRSSDSEHREGTRMLLHASEIGFTHPETNLEMHFISPPPF